VGQVQSDLTNLGIIVGGTGTIEPAIIDAIHATDVSGAVQSRNDLNAVLLSLGQDFIHIGLSPIAIVRLAGRNIIVGASHSHVHVVQEEASGVIVGEIQVQHIHLIPRQRVDEGLHHVNGVKYTSSIQVQRALRNVRIVADGASHHSGPVGNHALKHGVQSVQHTDGRIGSHGDVVRGDIQ